MDPAELNAIIEELRATNAQLTQKSQTRKARIAELEAIIAERDTALAGSRAQIRKLTVDAPMQAMAESLSTVPELFLEQFNKSHRLEIIDGEPTVVSVEDGKPIGVPFEREALRKHLTDEKNAQAKNFQAIVIASRASGAAGQVTQRTTEKKVTKPLIKNQFGLR